MEQQEQRCCKICGKKLPALATKTIYCSVNCVAKETELLEDGKNLSLSLKVIAEKYKTHKDKVAAVLSDAGIRPSYTKKITCLHCGKVSNVFGTQKYCSRACADKNRPPCKYKKPIEETKARKKQEKAKRRARKRLATTETANKKLLKLIYQHVPEGYQVDHIIPITKGGLHHEDNLQYLPAIENMRKSNRLDYIPENVIRWQDVIKLTEE